VKARQLVIGVFIVATVAAYYALRISPRTTSGEVFVQLRNGRVVYASAAEVTAFNRESERGRRWLQYQLLDEKRRKLREATYDARPEIRAARQMLLYGNDQVALGEILSMPASTGGERIDTVCGATGRFQLRLRPGTYWIVARGRAGEVNGIWSKEIDVPDEANIEFSEGDATFDHPIDE
jgi:uncharacterized membrane protein